VTEYHVAVVPVGKVRGDEVESVLSRASKVLRRPLELRGALPVPQGVEEPGRAQFRAALLLARLRSSFPQLGPGRLIGAESAEPASAAHVPDAIVFVTDVDLYTANSDAAFTALLPAKGLGVVSVRRLREAFYRRPADAGKQRSRLTKEVLRAAGRLQGMPQCASPQCVLAPSNMLADLDLKEEKLCRSCSQRMFQGTMRI
jgi:predicted Zn-dependent protease